MHFIDAYKMWTRNLEQFIDIEKRLEEPKSVQTILAIIDDMLEQSMSFRMDLRSEINKLKILRIWAQISKRYHERAWHKHFPPIVR